VASNDLKDLLLQDYRYRCEAMWKSEQSGETRVNLFIGLITLCVGAIGALVAKGTSLPAETLRFLVPAALSALLMVGLVTLARMITRNKNTDLAKHQLDLIRQTFKDHFDEGFVRYNLFPGIAPRGFGGLAHTVAVMNGLLCAGIVAAVVVPLSEVRLATVAADGLAIVLAFGAAVWLQLYYIDCEDRKSNASLTAAFPKPTHAGGVVFKVQDGISYYLLIRPKNKAAEWVLPQGHIEPGESHSDAALREVREETGVVARLAGPIGQVSFEKASIEQVSKFYLMERICEIASLEDRDRQWLPIEQALQQEIFEETRYLLHAAARRRTHAVDAISIADAGVPK
jgi:8-oxo-dGTP pyrophosphatase MutT (NUDIX family)